VRARDPLLRNGDSRGILRKAGESLSTHQTLKHMPYSDAKCVRVRPLEPAPGVQGILKYLTPRERVLL
jgi:hypothetical protein